MPRRGSKKPLLENIAPGKKKPKRPPKDPDVMIGVKIHKSEFITQLAKKAKLSRKDAKTALDTTLELIMDHCAKRTKLTFTGFGTFESRRTKATTRFNPRTRQRIHVGEKWVPKFRPGKSFKETLGRR